MKRFLLTQILILILFSGVFAIEINGGVYSEAGSGSLNRNTPLNVSNICGFNEINAEFEGSLNFKTDRGEIFGDHARGAIKLLADYYPSYYYGTNYEHIYIKEVYIDALCGNLNLRVGKQYIKWGSSIIFNPIDIINLQRDPMQPSNNEGNPFVYLLIPVKEFFSFELMTLFRPCETTNLSSLPVIPKLSFSYDMFSAFLFTQLEQDKRPFYGVNADITTSLSQNTTLKFYTEASYFDNSSASNVVLNDGLVSLEKADPDNSNPYRYKALAGTDLYLGFPDFKYLTSLDLYAEYLHYESAWGHQNFINYLDCLKTASVNPPVYFQIISNYQSYIASRDYTAIGCSFSDLFTEGLYWSQFVIINLTDLSLQYFSDLSFQFKNNNATVGFRVLQNIGDAKTEYGSQFFNSQYTLYLFVGM